MSAVLSLHGVTRRYGALTAVDDVTFDVAAGARHAVIGPNGAGKTTLFGMVSGRVPVSGGSIRYDGRAVDGLSLARRARAGIAQTYQHSSVFLGCTVEENVALAAQRRLGLARRLRPTAGRTRAVSDVAGRCLERVGLAARAAHPAAALSHGERRQLEVAIVLAVEPRLLLLDEPTAGMSPAETERFMALVAGLPADMTILVIEHDLDVVFSLATHVSVLEQGRLLLTGSPAEVRGSEAVQHAYLGAWAADEQLAEAGA